MLDQLKDEEPSSYERIMMSIRLRGTVSLATVSVLLSLGCSKKPAESPATATEVPSETPTEDVSGKDPGQAQVRLGPKIAEACGISATDTFFEYNSAKVSQRAGVLIDALVECFTNGPLAGRTMSLVGHADPRGDEEYNMALGGKRADNVASALVNKGLPETQKETTSRGELDATGTDEASWAQDRKVEITLVD